ncbi:twin arginine-targeting protein translocase TatB [Corynebacterium mustelae]|uniref:Sec-independent protein translocase protein TatB n=1 Tax=Corynebacterium mustelae TaxID=571915 RepID=A0A0G3GWL7_9CORY|nr:Sec-independent protein translocase protein TatB [Corynebacterium mustelae]AKK05559.1 twin arginine-targeting protein translocase TatB [Corynebacterium mustelae]
MFDSIGWFEILFILIIGLIIIGPEKMPGVIEDVRAAIFAARRAIDNAKKELNGELGDLGSEFDDIRKPISQIASMRAMGPKAAITKALFDGDERYLDDFDPKKALSEENLTGKNQAQPRTQSTPPAQPQPTPQSEAQPESSHRKGGSFSYDDIT